MSAVVDASVLVAATTDSGTEGTWAEHVVADGDLVAPHLAPVEATNILRRLEASRVLTSYDAWYVAVAEALELPLATLDRRLSRAAGPSCRFLLPR